MTATVHSLPAFARARRIARARVAFGHVPELRRDLLISVLEERHAVNAFECVSNTATVCGYDLGTARLVLEQLGYCAASPRKVRRA
jgi:hypothetical protein